MRRVLKTVSIWQNHILKLIQRNVEGSGKSHDYPNFCYREFRATGTKDKDRNRRKTFLSMNQQCLPNSELKNTLQLLVTFLKTSTVDFCSGHKAKDYSPESVN